MSYSEEIVLVYDYFYARDWYGFTDYEATVYVAWLWDIPAWWADEILDYWMY